MKKLLLVLLLCGCAIRTSYTNNLYDCAIFGPHGTYAHMKIGADSREEAYNSAEEVRQNLVDKKLVPEYSGIMCEKEEAK